MRIAIIGASGNIGSCIRDEALARGHQVTAIVRHPEKITVQNPHLTAVKADILRDKVDELVQGHDAIISAYNAGFEAGILKDLVVSFPEYSEWFDGIFSRIVDLLKPFSNFHYYNASQKDTASLKKVLPAVTGKNYDNMEIYDGTLASILYEQTTFGDATEEEREKVRTNLLEYCKQDTEGMIWIVDSLAEIKSIVF